MGDGEERSVRTGHSRSVQEVQWAVVALVDLRRYPAQALVNEVPHEPNRCCVVRIHRAQEVTDLARRVKAVSRPACLDAAGGLPFFHRDWPWRKPLGEWYLRDVIFVLLLGYFLLLLFAALGNI